MLRGILLSVVCISMVYAYSNGEAITCDTQMKIGGPASLKVKDGLKSDIIMWWARPPRHMGHSHTLRTGDADKKQDVKTYTPGEWMTIHVRTLIRGSKYNGLLLYAVDEDEKKVGEWELVPGTPFWLPTNAGCDGKAVLHSNAIVNNYHELFYFRMPADSTYQGKITFRCLLKQGDPFPFLKGYFIFPNDAPLQVTYKAPANSKALVWSEGELGESCYETCSRLGRSCDVNAFSDQDTTQKLLKTIKGQVVCPLPVMAGCSPLAPTKGMEGCWFGKDCSNTDNRCGEKTFRPEDGQRICPCKAGTSPTPKTKPPTPPTVQGGITRPPTEKDAPTHIPPTPIPPTNPSPTSFPTAPTPFRHINGGQGMAPTMNPTAPTASTPEEPEAGNAVSASPRSLFVLLLGLCVTGATSNGASRKFLLLSVLLIMLCNLPTTSAHNWVRSPRGRRNMASNKCRKSIETHMQIGAGQKFPFEWTTGHGGIGFIVVLRRTDEAYIGAHSNKNLNDYVDSKPKDSTYYRGVKKYHVGSIGGSQYCKDCFDGTKKLSVERGPVFGPKIDKDKPVEFQVYKGKKGDLDSANYFNSKYPWLMAVHKYVQNFPAAFETDIMELEIPSGSPSGKYMIHWIWHGFMDCVNVNVLDKPSTDLFGVNAGWQLVRVDHCRFVYQGYSTGRCTEVKQGGNIDQEVMKVCLDSKLCRAVQLVPVDLKGAKLAIAFNFRALAAECKGVGSYAKTSQVVYIVKERGQPEPHKLEISEDPEDDIFYSTCWRKMPKYDFKQTCAKCQDVKILPQFKFGTRCISCQDAFKWDEGGQVVPPFWNMTDNCEHCDDNLGKNGDKD